MKFFGPLFILCIILYCNNNDDNFDKHHLDTCNTDEPKTNIEKKIKVLIIFVTWCSIPKGNILTTGKLRAEKPPVIVYMKYSQMNFG